MPVGDVRVKEIKINLDRERHLRFDLNAFADLEEEYGNISIAFDELQKGSIKALRFMLYVGLKHEDEALTIQKVGALIGMGNIQELTSLITDAAVDSLPDEKEGNANSQPEK